MHMNIKTVRAVLLQARKAFASWPIADSEHSRTDGNPNIHAVLIGLKAQSTQNNMFIHTLSMWIHHLMLNCSAAVPHKPDLFLLDLGLSSPHVTQKGSWQGGGHDVTINNRWTDRQTVWMKVYVPKHPGKLKIDAGKISLPGGFARFSSEGTVWGTCVGQSSFTMSL